MPEGNEHSSEHPAGGGSLHGECYLPLKVDTEKDFIWQWSENVAIEKSSGLKSG